MGSDILHAQRDVVKDVDNLMLGAATAWIL
jgi:hypothetical protein